MRIEQAKTRRLEKEEASTGATLTNGGGDDGLPGGASLSAADWVAQSRTKAASAADAKTTMKARAKSSKGRGKRVSAGTGAAGSELEGLALQHGASDFSEGDDVILTLADSQILDRDEHGALLGVAGDGVDVLENATMREAELRAKRDRLKSRAKQPMYSGYDDDEFDETTTAAPLVIGRGVGGAPPAQRGVLSHYDIERREEQRGKPKLVLGSRGVVHGEAAPDAEPAPTFSTTTDDAHFSSANMNEYYSKDEYEVRYVPCEIANRGPRPSPSPNPIPCFTP